MTDDRNQSQRSGQSRKPQLSPDVAEFLHMLNALEMRSSAELNKAG